MAPREDGNWHLDKKVPLGIIFAIFVQTVVFVAFFSSFISETNNRLMVLEKAEEKANDNATKITILEQQYIFVQNTLTRIETKLDAAKVALEKVQSADAKPL